MNSNEIWNCETPVTDLLGIDTPAWIDSEIDPAAIAAVVQGGCASGAYMPAVTYHTALRIMADHGDDVLEYLEDLHGEIPAPPAGASWSGMACHYLSYAVEMWAAGVYTMLEDHDLETAEA